jgi:hypothetical protein
MHLFYLSTLRNSIKNIQVNLFRVAFLLERMCPVATGLGATFNETVRHFVDGIWRYIYLPSTLASSPMRSIILP